MDHYAMLDVSYYNLAMKAHLINTLEEGWATTLPILHQLDVNQWDIKYPTKINFIHQTFCLSFQIDYNIFFIKWL